MKSHHRSIVGYLIGLSIVALIAGCATPTATSSGGVQRLYVLYCGEGDAPDLSRWTPGVAANVNKPVTLSDSCYLIKHAKGWMLWETGFNEAIVGKPEGFPTPVIQWHWRGPKSLTQQLADIGVKPDDIAYLGFSHAHPDHVGNGSLFTRAQLLIQEPEYDFYFGPKATPPAAPANWSKLRDNPTVKLHGDYDVFGDGSVTILASPGHTPGHQSLLVKLPRTGPVLLTGDAAHYRTNWDTPRAPVQNFDKEATITSLTRLKKVADENHAQVWINHDIAETKALKMSPAYYE